MPQTTAKELTDLHAQMLEYAALEFRKNGRFFDLSTPLSHVKDGVSRVLDLKIVRPEYLIEHSLIIEDTRPLRSSSLQLLYEAIAGEICFCFNAAVVQTQSDLEKDSERMRVYEVPCEISGIQEDTPLINGHFSV